MYSVVYPRNQHGCYLVASNKKFTTNLNVGTYIYVYNCINANQS